MSIIKNILQIIGMIILIFCGLLGMLLFIMGMVEAIPLELSIKVQSKDTLNNEKQIKRI